MNNNDFASQLLQLAIEEREEKTTIIIPAGTYWLGDMCAFDKAPAPTWITAFGGDAGWGIEDTDGWSEEFTTYGAIGLYPVTEEDLENNDLEGLILGKLVTFEQDTAVDYTYLREDNNMGISLVVPGVGKVLLAEQPTDLKGLFDHIINNMDLAYWM